MLTNKGKACLFSQWKFLYWLIQEELYILNAQWTILFFVWNSYGDITTQSNGEEGLYYKNGTVQANKVKLLSRTFAQVMHE